MVGYVYFIKPVGMEGPVKIGHSQTPESRLSQLGTWSPFPLEIAVCVPGGLALERNIHERLHASHSHREWFHPTEEVLSLLWKLKIGVPLEEAINLDGERKKLRVNRPVLTADDRLYRSLAARVHWAIRKTEQKVGGRRFTPMWLGEVLRQIQAGDTSEANVSQVEAFLSDPENNSYTQEQHKADWHDAFGQTARHHLDA